MNNNQLENLLKVTASRLGTTPEALKSAAESGQLNKVIGQNADTSKFQQVLNDPEAAKKLLSTPQAQKLMELFNNKNDNV